MKRIVIIVEGDTEMRFVNETLIPFLYNNGVNSNISAFKIKHTRGGLTKYAHLKTDILNAIYGVDVIVTTLIDFYALPSDFPKYDLAKQFLDKNDKVTFLETAIREDIEGTQNRHFSNLIPYIQLHEFEALTFTSMNGFRQHLEPVEANFIELEKIVNAYPNPEEINDSPNTAPSKRLIEHIKGYDKVAYGNLFIQANGIELILAKCPRFRNWTEALIERATEA